ncbi:hypothetical protein GVAV_001638 [Gurleya vavrai]
MIMMSTVFSAFPRLLENAACVQKQDEESKPIPTFIADKLKRIQEIIDILEKSASYDLKIRGISENKNAETEQKLTLNSIIPQFELKNLHKAKFNSLELMINYKNIRKINLKLFFEFLQPQEKVFFENLLEYETKFNKILSMSIPHMEVDDKICDGPNFVTQKSEIDTQIFEPIIIKLQNKEHEKTMRFFLPKINEIILEIAKLDSEIKNLFIF